MGTTFSVVVLTSCVLFLTVLAVVHVYLWHHFRERARREEEHLRANHSREGQRETRRTWWRRWFQSR
jgi:hypothetical protein